MPLDAYESKVKLQESVEEIMRKIGVELFVNFKSRIP
jgi:hypothetical protein